MNEIKLKPCPFCGGNAILNGLGFSHSVYCEDCGANIHGTGGMLDKLYLVEVWNKRVELGDIIEDIVNAITCIVDTITDPKFMETFEKAIEKALSSEDGDECVKAIAAVAREKGESNEP